MPDDLHVPWTLGHASAIHLEPPEVENVTFARPGFGDRATELLLPVLDVRLPVEDLDEVEVAVVGLLEKIKLDAPSLFCTLFIHHSS